MANTAPAATLGYDFYCRYHYCWYYVCGSLPVLILFVLFVIIDNISGVSHSFVFISQSREGGSKLIASLALIISLGKLDSGKKSYKYISGRLLLFHRKMVKCVFPRLGKKSFGLACRQRIFCMTNTSHVLLLKEWLLPQFMHTGFIRIPNKSRIFSPQCRLYGIVTRN